MLPIEFKERMRSLLGEAESERLFDEIENGAAVRSFRINPIKTTVADFEASGQNIDKKPLSFPHGAYYTEEKNPGRLPCHHSGAIYMQDPSAMATIHAIDVPMGARILDSCSAPGGKTTQLAAFAGDTGFVVANEYEAKRCRILQSNVERLGCRNTVVVNLDTAVLAETYPDTFDVVLCDAPCSGEGMFRKNELAISEWSPENVTMCAERQREILGNVAKCVARGGRLIYSTCTFSLEENEMNVAWFLDNFEDFELCSVRSELEAVTSSGICIDGCEYDMTKTRRFYPHVSKGEGQFIAVMKRADRDLDLPPEQTGKKDKKKKTPQVKRSKEEVELLEEASAFLSENLERDFALDAKYELVALGGKAYLKPEIHLPPFGVFAAGVCVGEMIGRRFAPHHQLFSAFGQSFLRRVVLKYDDAEALNYLKGLEISVADKLEASGKKDGWAAVIVDGCSLGGGKISGGVCKNHYPKGLRNQQ